ncbi:MAG: DUF3127 domain-containing protein [Endomicrobium sp.]|nr:DUF3127 domain-containing protein [Endomicrobium sp.]
MFKEIFQESSGESNGVKWHKADVVVWLDSMKHDELCFTTFDDATIDLLKTLKKEQVIKIYFTLKSKMFNGKYWNSFQINMVDVNKEEFYIHK